MTTEQAAVAGAGRDAAVATRWTPLGTAAWRATIDGAVRDIADALASHVPAFDAAHYNAHELVLFDGRAGLAVFHGELAHATGDERHAALAWQRLDDAVTGMAETELAPSLFSGYTGIAWLAQHLQRLSGAPAGDVTDEIDDALLAHLRGMDPEQDFDLLWGLAGYGLYALDRASPVSRVCVVEVIDRLSRTAHERPGGLAWFRPGHRLYGSRRDYFSAGIYDTGIAHGAAGVIGVLARVSAAGIERTRVRRLLDGAARWLWHHRLDPDQRYQFAPMIGPDGRSCPSRFGWCYGDLGVATALLTAGMALDDAALIDHGLAAAHRAAAVPLDDSTVFEPWLCHGAAGVGHMFNRLFQATGEPVFADAAVRWLDRCLAMRRSDRALAGWVDPPRAWSEQLGLADGLAGLGLVLLAAISPVAPSWDGLLGGLPDHSSGIRSRSISR